jgi:hypothetical protein
VTAKKERTGKIIAWGLGVLLVLVLGFTVWVTTLLVRAHDGKVAAAAASGVPLEDDHPWKNNPYTTTLPPSSAAPGAPPKP